MDKLTVGIFLESYPNQQAGGGFFYNDALIEAIKKYEFDKALEIKFIHTGIGNDFSSHDKIQQIKPYRHINKKTRYKQYFNYTILRRFKKFLKPLSRLHLNFQTSFEMAYLRGIEQELVTNNIDLIYYLFPTAHHLNYPFVSTNWDAGHKSMFSFPEVAMNDSMAVRQKYFEDTLEKAFAIFCESEAGKTELIHYTNINEDRVFIVPIFAGNVINLKVSNFDQMECLKRYGLFHKKYFFYPAQFWSHKNHYNLLLAFKRLIKSQPDTKMLFTGSDKGNLDYIKNVMTSLDLQNNVIMPGFVSYEELYSFYKHALAMVMPTFLGPTNMPLLEAEALGCPVICSDLKGHREMLGENAWYVQPDNPLSIYEAMQGHLSPINRQPYLNETFNISNAVKQIEANFLQLKSRRKTFGFNFKQY